MASSTSDSLQAPSGAHILDKIMLLNYLKKNTELVPGNCAAITVQKFGHGQSNPTYLITVGTRKLVLRKKPPGKILKYAHAVEREFQVLRALRQTKVPIPQVHCFCDDVEVVGTPFYLMDYVEGRIFTDPRLPHLSAGERHSVYRAMAEALAAIHSVNVDLVGLGSFGSQASYCKRQLERWSRQYSASTAPSPHGPPADPAVLRVMAWLRGHIPPEDSFAGSQGLVHGDFRLDNLVFHPSEPRVLAVLDWELATLGSQMTDLAYCCMPFHLPAGTPVIPGLLEPSAALPAGIPSEPEFLACYCQAAAIPLALPSWRFYLALSLFKAAAIFAGVYHRALQGNASSPEAILTGQFPSSLAHTALKVILAEPGRGAGPDPSSGQAEGVGSPLGLSPSARCQALVERVHGFLQRHLPEAVEQQLESHASSAPPIRWTVHPLVERLKREAQREGLWNLWISPELAAKGRQLAEESAGACALPLLGVGLSNLEYAHVCQQMGRSVWAPELFNCSAPDTGNMEVLLRYGTLQQQRRWLLPLLRGEARSCFAMTEPQVASSDASNMQAALRREGGHYVLKGRKWWASGACDPRCSLAIFMGRTLAPTDPASATACGDALAPAGGRGGAPHRKHSMILVDMKSAGLTVVRPLTVFGYDDAPHGHAELDFDDVRVPAGNMLLGEGRGFEIAQGRLGPGRLHHCMRLVGAANRALELMAQRSLSRSAFGRPLAEHGAAVQRMAECRVEVEAARLLVLNAALELDLRGNKQARHAIAWAKVATPRAAQKVLDAAIQLHGAMGVSSDAPLARLWIAARTLRIADGPDEVHLASIGKAEIAKARL